MQQKCANSPISIASSRNLAKDSNGRTQIFLHVWAVFVMSERIMDFHREPSPSSQKARALFKAIKDEKIRQIASLLEKGCNVNAQDSQLQVKSPVFFLTFQRKQNHSQMFARTTLICFVHRAIEKLTFMASDHGFDATISAIIMLHCLSSWQNTG